MTEEIVQYESSQAVKVFQPVMSIAEMKDRYQMMARITGEIMREGQDYGAIPGTGKKPSLLKPGAEKLTTFFGLRKEFDIVKQDEDWMGTEHGGEPFFYYLVRCSLWRDNVLVAAADGSCNSWESRYRYRKAERVCPQCQADAIIKGKQEYGGGWVCFKKRGGCGAKFPDGDQAIEGQQTGRILNKDIYDQVNTILKMAEKRALVATTLLAVAASEFFTQDMEDIIDGDWTEQPKAAVTSQPQKRTAAPTEKANPAPDPEPPDSNRPWKPDELRAKLVARAHYYHGKEDNWAAEPEAGHVGAMTGKLNGILGDDDRRHTFLLFVFDVSSSRQLDRGQVQAVLDWMKQEDAMATVTDEANRLVNDTVAAEMVGTLFDEEESDDVG